MNFKSLSKKIADDVISNLQVQVPQQGMEFWLNRLLAEEVQAWYQYYMVCPFLVGDERPHIQETFKANADDELNDHGDKLIQRLHDLGFQATWLEAGPASLAQYVGVPYIDPTVDVNNALQVMIKSENDAINSYSQAVQVAAQLGDVVSRDIFKEILADEQTHLANLTHFVLDKQV